MSDKYNEIEKAFLLFKQNRSLPDTVPSGWFTTCEFAEAKKVNRSCASKMLSGLHNAGVVEKKNFKIHDSMGRAMPILHWKTKTNAKKKENTQRRPK